MKECQNDDCEGTVTEQFARVFGDNNDVIHHCPDCATVTEIKQGTGGNISQDL